MNDHNCWAAETAQTATTLFFSQPQHSSSILKLIKENLLQLASRKSIRFVVPGDLVHTHSHNHDPRQEASSHFFQSKPTPACDGTDASASTLLSLLGHMMGNRQTKADNENGGKEANAKGQTPESGVKRNIDQETTKEGNVGKTRKTERVSKPIAQPQQRAMQPTKQ
eukprot:3684439-Rhodomonas_salina.1